jgi:cobalamin transport system substrate-binding protein
VIDDRGTLRRRAASAVGAARRALLAAALLAAAAPLPAQIALADDRGRTLTLPAPALRVVSLLPSLTETVCALQACDRLIATDRHSNWPPSVRALPKLGGLEDTQIERLVALRPDLVLTARSARAVDRLEALGVPVLALEPRNLEQTGQAIATVAAALGRPAAGVTLIRQLDERIAAAAARVPAALRGRRVYVEVASTPHAAGEASFVGELLARLGLANVVPAALGPFPQLNPEFVLRAQPDVMIASAATVSEMPRRPGWDALNALRAGRVCGLAPEPWDALVRPGPRLAEAAEAIADCLAGTIPR